jgi:hypothetical protein
MAQPVDVSKSAEIAGLRACDVMSAPVMTVFKAD